jgi:histidinol-phosphate aminotransferase
MMRENVAIGRTWPAMPNHVRVTIGTREEMAKFRTAFGRVMNV